MVKNTTSEIWDLCVKADTLFAQTVKSLRSLESIHAGASCSEKADIYKEASDLMASELRLDSNVLEALNKKY